ncbi:MAG: hypothetical protein JSS68_20060 [Actinobacteria bacterium]|nr:hypothetical protein [Actinomycetota bacterium]
MTRLGTVGGAVLICLAVLGGCGGGGGLDKDELAKSVKQSAEVFAAESMQGAESALERAFEETGVPTSEAEIGEVEFHLGEEPCQDARKGQPAPTGTKPIYACFVHYVTAGGSAADEVEMDITVYSVDHEQCWKGVLVNLESGVGTSEFYDGEIPQRRIDSGAEDLEGCIGKKPGPQGPLLSGEVTEEQEERSEEVVEREAAEKAEAEEAAEAEAKAAAGEAGGDSSQAAERAGVEYGPPQNLESCGTVDFPPGESEQRQVSGANLSCPEVKADVEHLLEGQVPVQGHLPPGWSLDKCANYEGTFLYCTHGDEAFAISAPTAFFLGE